MLHVAVLICLSVAQPDNRVLDELVEGARRAWKVPGAAIVVVRGDETIVLKGYGVRKLGNPQPVTAETVFPLASCTKSFTTTLLAMFADEGRIGWDDSVRKHLPDFHLSDPHADTLLTIRDLLCHRSGIGGHDLLWYRAPWGGAEIVRRVQLLPLDYPFRSGYRYSSIPFLVAGQAIEKSTAQKWEELVEKRICRPLGMTGVSFTTTGIPADADRAEGHRVGKGGKVETMAGYAIAEPNPSGSVNATAADLATWLKFHLAKGVGPDGKRLVSVKNLTETHTPQNLIPMRGSARTMNPDTVQLSYGMGWVIHDYRGKKVISHGGMIDGFRVQITFLPNEDFGIAVFTNLDRTHMTHALTNTLIDHLAGLPVRDWNAYYRKAVDEEAAERRRDLAARDRARDRDAKPSLPPLAYDGNYTHRAYGTATVTAKDGKLALRYGNFNCPLEHFESDTFRVKEGFFEEQLVVFVVKHGKVAGVRFQGQEFARQ